VTRPDREPTRWMIRQNKRWFPLLGTTYGPAMVNVRRQLMHGFVLVAVFIGLSMLWDITLWKPAGEVLGVASAVVFAVAACISFTIPTVRLLQLQAKVARHLRAKGVSIRHWPDLRDPGVYLAWCRREGLEPSRVASVLDLPQPEQGS
jgi:hypothetical protein